MAEKSLALSILTPYGKAYEGDVTSVVAPGTLGYLGILYNHAPLATTLQPGKFTCRDGNCSEQVFLIKSDGFLEVLNNKVTVLVKTVERLGE